MKRRVKFNVNDYVHVRLRDPGRRELGMQRAEIESALGRKCSSLFPNEDVNGWSRWQMHDLMCTLGKLCTIGFDPPFETTIEIEVDAE